VVVRQIFAEKGNVGFEACEGRRGNPPALFFSR